MDDLSRRFAGLNDVATPDLWPDVERRVAARVDRVASPVGTPALTFGSARLGSGRLSGWAMLLIAAIVAVSLVTAGLMASRRPFAGPATLPSAAGLEPVANSPTIAVPSATAPCATPVEILRLDVSPIIPGGLIAADCAIWAIHRPDGAVVRIDPATGGTEATIRLSDPASSLTASGADIWAAGRVTRAGTPLPEGYLARIDPATNAVAASLTVPVDGDRTFGTRKTPTGVFVDVVGGTGVVHAMMVSDPPIKATVVDLASGRVRGTIEDGNVETIGSTVVLISPRPGGAGGVRISDLDLSTLGLSLVRDDPDIATFSVGRAALVATTWRNEVVEISPTTGDATTIPLGFGAADSLEQASAGAVTVVLRGVLTQLPGEAKPGVETRELVFLDNVTKRVVLRTPLIQRSPVELWTGLGRVWVLGLDGTVRSFPIPTT